MRPILAALIPSAATETSRKAGKPAENWATLDGGEEIKQNPERDLTVESHPGQADSEQCFPEYRDIFDLLSSYYSACSNQLVWGAGTPRVDSFAHQAGTGTGLSCTAVGSRQHARIPNLPNMLIVEYLISLWRLLDNYPLTFL